MIFCAHQDSDQGIGGISVVSGGHIFAENGRTIYRPSGRSDYLLFYVSKGKELFHLDTNTVASEGSFLFYRPNEVQHHVYIDNRTGEFYYVHFNAPEDFDLFGLESSRVYNTRAGVEVQDLFEEIISELQMKQPAYERVCVSKLFNIISLLLRGTEQSSKPKSRYFDKIYFVLQKMNQEYHISYSLDEYAKMCNMSKFHFLREFREITGMSPI